MIFVSVRQVVYHPGDYPFRRDCSTKSETIRIIYWLIFSLVDCRDPNIIVRSYQGLICDLSHFFLILLVKSTAINFNLHFCCIYCYFMLCTIYIHFENIPLLLLLLHPSSNPFYSGGGQKWCLAVSGCYASSQGGSFFIYIIYEAITLKPYHTMVITSPSFHAHWNLDKWISESSFSWIWSLGNTRRYKADQIKVCGKWIYIEGAKEVYQ